MRALVIGADGFAGRWLLRHLLDSGDDVAAAVGPGYGDTPLPGDIEPLRVDVRDAERLNAIVGSARPRVIYYLAGVSRSGARDDLDRALGVSVHGAINTMAATAKLEDVVRLVHVGSSHMYAVPADETPISEDASIRPTTVYGAAKAAAEAALVSLARAAGVEVVAIRAFNHIGPGQQPGFVVPSLARQVVAIRRGEQEPVIRAGNIDARRDFTDVRDVVRAYRIAAVQGRPGEAYNVASGRAISVRTMLDVLMRLRSVAADVTRDPELSRTGEAATAMIGDASKLTDLTGWEPEISIDQSLEDILDSLDEPE